MPTRRVSTVVDHPPSWEGRGSDSLCTSQTLLGEHGLLQVLVRLAMGIILGRMIPIDRLRGRRPSKTVEKGEKVPFSGFVGFYPGKSRKSRKWHFWPFSALFGSFSTPQSAKNGLKKVITFATEGRKTPFPGYLRVENSPGQRFYP